MNDTWIPVFQEILKSFELRDQRHLKLIADIQGEFNRRDTLLGQMVEIITRLDKEVKELRNEKVDNIILKDKIE